jgi:hypothetical protein
VIPELLDWLWLTSVVASGVFLAMLLDRKLFK